MEKLISSFKILLKLLLKTSKNLVPNNPIAFLEEFTHLSEVKGILIGQDPYAYSCSMTGKPLAIGKLFATSCKRSPLTLREFQRILEEALLSFGIKHKVSNDLYELTNMGIMAMNASWTTEYTSPNAHSGKYLYKNNLISYQQLSRKVVTEVMKANPYRLIPIVAFGKNAREVVQGLKGNVQIFHSVHPAAVRHGYKLTAEPLIQLLNTIFHDSKRIRKCLIRKTLLKR